DGMIEAMPQRPVPLAHIAVGDTGPDIPRADPGQTVRAEEIVNVRAIGREDIREQHEGDGNAKGRQTLRAYQVGEKSPAAQRPGQPRDDARDLYLISHCFSTASQV